MEQWWRQPEAVRNLSYSQRLGVTTGRRPETAQQWAAAEALVAGWTGVGFAVDAVATGLGFLLGGLLLDELAYGAGLAVAATAFGLLLRLLARSALRRHLEHRPAPDGDEPG